MRVEAAPRSLPADRISAAAHVAMAIAMVVMIGWHPVAPGWVPGLFTAMGLWFFALAVPPGRRLPNLHHAAMAGAMAWMTASHHARSVALGIYFCLAAVAWMRRPHVGHAAMTAAMAAMLLAI